MSYEENPDNMTPREAADELSAERWEDERRERYAAPLFEIMRDNGWDGERTEQVNREMFAVADAAMAVADEEIRKNGLRIAFDTARKLGELAREISRLRAELEDYEGGAEHDNDLVEELRLDLREAQESGSHNFKVAMDQWNKIRQVRTYALSRCTEEFGDYASASVVLGILDGEINIEEENEPL